MPEMITIERKVFVKQYEQCSYLKRNCPGCRIQHECDIAYKTAYGVYPEFADAPRDKQNSVDW